MLGNKSPECFIYSGLHDSDDEFLRRYGEPVRASWMISHYRDHNEATHAVARLTLLTRNQATR